MKPIKLYLENFITYRKTEIDFTQLENRLFLISGKTGAGKTTLFDGIMFAMYGTTSGAERDVQSLHCNYDKENKPTKAILDFEEDGKLYHIERTMKYSKKGDSYVWKVDASLTGPDKTESGATKVTECIEELTGMNAGQFRQTSMLAQGKFREFLNGGTKEREAILSKLFDTSASKRYQRLIAAACDRLNKELSQLNSEIITQTNLFASKLPTDMPEIERLKFDPEALDQCENMIAFIAERMAGFEALSAEKEKLLVTVQAANARITAAKAENAKLDALELAVKRLRELERQKSFYAEFAQANERAERALMYCRPAEKALSDAETKKQKAEAEYAQVLIELEKAEKDVKAAQARLAELSDTQKKIEEKTSEKGAVEQLIPNYAEKDRQAEILSDAEKAMKEARKIAEDKRAMLERASGQRDELNALIETLKDAGEERFAAEAKCDTLEKAEKALQELKLAVVKARRADEKCTEAENEAVKALAALKLADDTFTAVNDRYFAAQAANLASELGKQLEIGDACCPVCGTKHAKGTVIVFNTAETVERSKVDTARKRAEAAQKTLDACKDALGKAKSAAESAWAAAVTLAKPALGIEEREALTDEILANETVRLAGELAEGQAQLAAATERKARLDKAKQDIDKLQKQETSLRSELDEAIQRVSEANARAEAAKAAIKALQLDARFADGAQVQAYINRLQRETEQLTNTYNTADKALKQAENNESALKGKKEKSEQNCRDAAANTVEREKELETAVTEAGFADRDAAKAALVEAGKDPESWLKTRKLQLKQYENNVHAAEEDAKKRTEEARNCVRRNLEELRGEMESAEQTYKETEAHWNVESSALEIQRGTCEKITGIRKKRDEANVTFKRLDKLNSVANGKQSFSIWCLAADFKDVLHLSNEHLARMSGGRFEMELKEDVTDARKINGLDIEVIDHDSGHREAPTALSGGEGFETSMALALGLSDAARSGGMRKVETLFVDEGFGTLDDEMLDSAIQLLRGLSDGNRTVGIISHVNRLEESIRPQVCVSYQENQGSTAKIMA